MKAKIDKIKFETKHSQTLHQMFEIPIEINRLALKALAKTILYIF
jgi:ribose 5-phosphate isomerase